jgi:DNA repair exonuclease SbcCD ATPase subunit
MDTKQAAVDRQPRLTALGHRIDSLQEKARRVGADARATANRRVDDLRARHAEARADLREMRDALTEERSADLFELDAELSELEHEIEISDAELDAEMAAEVEAFVEAGDRAAAAWDAYLQRLDERAVAAGDSAVETLRQSVSRAGRVREEAKRRIDEARRASSDSWTAARASVREAFDDLDWAAEQAAADIARYFD